MEGRFRPATCVGRSMEPAIRAGTRVVVDTDWHRMAPGDVVCFEDARDGGWVMHRVLGRFGLLGRTWFVQAPEHAREAGVVGDERVVGRVRGTDGDIHRRLTARERLVAARTVLRWLVGAVWRAGRATRRSSGDDARR